MGSEFTSLVALAMRVGQNPTKKAPELPPENYTHRIIIPVYIPNLEDYFEQSLDILKHTLTSLIKTCHSKTAITIIDNASCDEVKTYLRELLNHKSINCLIHHDKNIGKVDAILQVVRGCLEPFITLSDADVLFYSGWQEHMEQLHLNFPKAGICSPCPMPNMVWAHNAPMWWDNGFGLAFQFKSVVHQDALDSFERSIGRLGKHFESVHRTQQLTITKNGITACVGCGHFVATFKRDILLTAPLSRSKMALGGKSVAEYLDKPNEKSGYWRLSSTQLLAEHMGNRMEKRFSDHLNSLPEAAPKPFDLGNCPEAKPQALRSAVKIFAVKVYRKLKLYKPTMRRAGLEARFNPQDV